MHALTASGLKHNPAEALPQARSGPVVVLNRNNPDAVLIGLEEGGLLQAPGVRAALAAALSDGLALPPSGSRPPKPTPISTHCET